MSTSKTRTKEITIQVPYGQPNITSFWAKDSTLGEKNYTDKLVYYTVTKRINNLWFGEVFLVDIGSTEQDYVKRGNTCKIFTNNTILLKGRMESVKYDSYNCCKVSIVGMSSKMKESQNNTTYTNTATSTIVTALASGTGLSVGTNTNYGNVTVRFDNENCLKGIHDLADGVDYYWYETWGGSTSTYPYDSDYINFHSSIGSTSATYTFNATGASANMDTASKDTNIDKQCNYVVALGYGDGINQLKTEVFHAALTARTTIATTIDHDDTTISLTDASDFPASGNVWVGCEKVTYTGKSGNNLTTCTRGVASMGNVAYLPTWVANTSGYSHDAGAPVYDFQYTTASPESGSSIDTYGVIKKRYTDKRIVDQNALDIFAAKILDDKKDPVEMITIQCSEPLEVLEDVSLGDNVSVTDSVAVLSGNYKVVGMVFGFNGERGEYLDLELSNKRESFIDQVSNIEQDTERVNVYMQGSTNIYAISESENCDDSTNLDLRFYLPSEAVAINKVKLNFKMKDFRYYTTTTPSGGGHTSSSTTHTHTTQSDTSPYHTHDILIYQRDVSGDDAVYFNGPTTGTLGVSANSGAITTDGTVTVHTHTISASGAHTHTISDHTHTMSPTIVEETLSNESVDLYIGEDGGSMTKKATYTTDQTDLDITAEVQKIGTSKWVNLQFRPNKRMRIEANAYVQIFVKSS